VTRQTGVAALIDRKVSAVAPPNGGLAPFARWVAESCTPGATVLNVGAGRSKSGAMAAVSRRTPYLVGIDPDASIHDNQGLDERHQATIEEFADDNAGRFDVAFSVYVLEHVCEPDAFLSACARVLRPGGTFFGLTLNMYQYFGLITWASTRLRVAEPILVRLKGQERVDGYHFATQYRLNSVRRLSRGLEQAGFESVEFRCYDDARRYAWYLPERVACFAPWYSRMVYAVGTPRLMGHLMFRAVRG
jgi:SAM-dependent methyltransferase